MPIKVTRQALEFLGINPGVVSPASQGTLYPPILQNDWASQVKVTTSWQTAISRSPFTGTEQRDSLGSRPVRSVQTTFKGMSQAESTSVQMSLMSMMGVPGSKQGVPFPIYSDFAITKNQLGSTETLISCDTIHKRFYIGQRIALVNPYHARAEYSGVKAYATYAIVKNISFDSIEIEDPIGEVLPLGSIVYPLIDCLPSLSMNTQLVTDYYSEATITATEKDAGSTLPPTWIGEIDQYFDYHEGYPIFDFVPNYASTVTQGYIRYGRSNSTGRSTTVSLNEDKPVLTYSFSDLNTSREEAWQLLQFFDSRRGRALPFWTVQPLTTWKALDITTSSITVPDYDYRANIGTYISHVAIIDHSDKVYIKSIENISAVGDSFVLGFPVNEEFSTVPTVKRVAPAWLARFASDTLDQSWITDHHQTSDITIEQLSEEKSVSVTNL